MKKISALLLSLATALTVSVCASAELEVIVTGNVKDIMETVHNSGAKFKTTATGAGEEVTMLAIHTTVDPLETPPVIDTDSIMALDQQPSDGNKAEFTYTLRGGSLEKGYYVVKVGGANFETAKTNTINVSDGVVFDEESSATPEITLTNQSVSAVGDLAEIAEGVEVYCGVVLQSVDPDEDNPLLKSDIFFPVYSAKGGTQKAITKNGKFNIVLDGLYDGLKAGTYKITSYYTDKATINGITDVQTTGTVHTFTVAEKPEQPAE